MIDKEKFLTFINTQFRGKKPNGTVLYYMEQYSVSLSDDELFSGVKKDDAQQDILESTNIPTGRIQIRLGSVAIDDEQALNQFLETHDFDFIANKFNTNLPIVKLVSSK